MLAQASELGNGLKLPVPRPVRSILVQPSPRTTRTSRSRPVTLVTGTIPEGVAPEQRAPARQNSRGPRPVRGGGFLLGPFGGGVLEDGHVGTHDRSRRETVRLPPGCFGPGATSARRA